MKSKKTTALVLVTAMLMSLFALVSPLGVSAANAGQLAIDIKNYNSAFTASVEGTTVRVTGTVTGATTTLLLEIDRAVTVVWEATLYGSSAPRALVELAGGTGGCGKFEVAQGGSIVNTGAGNAIEALAGSDNLELAVSGGTVSASDAAIVVRGKESKIAVSAGKVSSSDKEALYIAFSSSNSKVTVSGGALGTAKGDSAIFADNTGPFPGTNITVSGGSVTNDNPLSGAGIRIFSAKSTFSISDGTVKSANDCAINIQADASTVNVSGGTVSSVGTGVGTITVAGTISTVNINGGTVSATDGEAISVSGLDSGVKVNGGFVFAYGTAIEGSGNVIDIASGDEPVIGGSGVVCAWNKSAGNTAYNSETTTDMVVSPAGKAAWGVSGAVSGIAYENGQNKGFFPISLVTVTPMAYTVKFETDGGGTIANQTVNSGSKAAKPADPKKEGFEFKGWYKEEATTNAYDFDTPIKSNLTLYAKWEKAAEPEPEPKPEPKPDPKPDPKPEDKASMANFVKKNTYTGRMFSDVDENKWYGFNQGKAIASAYEYGLMKGNSATSFNPTGDITVAEAITVAARVHSIYTTGKEDFAAGATPWYQPYVDYAVQNKIISSGDFTNYTRAATRAEMAYIFSRSLSADEFKEQNTVNEAISGICRNCGAEPDSRYCQDCGKLAAYHLPDVSDETPHSRAILTLYKAGIVTGSDIKGTFNPMAKINRAEAAAIISRVILPSTRLSGKTFSGNVYVISEYYDSEGGFSRLGLALLEVDSEKVLKLKGGDIFIIGTQKYMVTGEFLKMPFYTQPSLEALNIWWAEYGRNAEEIGVAVKVN